MKPTPPSPRSTISWPAGCLTILSCFSIERTSESERPWNSFACLISTTPEYYAPAAGLHKDHVEPSLTQVSEKGCGWSDDRRTGRPGRSPRHMRSARPPLRLLHLLLAVQECLVEAVCLLLAAVDDLRIALQRVEVGVPEDLLHQAHVAPRHLQQRRGRGMAGHVRRFERPRADLLADQLHDVSRAGGCKASLAVIAGGAVEVDEHRKARVIARVEVFLHRVTSVGGEVHAPLLRPLTCDHEAVARAWEVGAVEGKRLGDAAAGADEELHERAIALFERRVTRKCRQQSRQLVGVNRLGKSLFELRQRDSVGEVALDQSFARNPAQPRADRDQRAGARRGTLQSRGEMALVRAQVFVAQISALEGVVVAGEKSEQFPDLGFISANRVRAAVGFEL